MTTLRLSEPTSIKLADLLACAYAADHGEQTHPSSPTVRL
ncbi:hypothetical protein HNQ08_003005 [Deinococcus humi]|uniref:Uncharacterized protein n=1 Tax=Deinococcus humi TaxID=662880 RepID=A0A7W8NGK6_9DEIO|nr:hypothetical protein [Deinococcus humi]